MRTFISAFSLCFLLACAAEKNATSTARTANRAEEPVNSNNLISVSGPAGPGGQDEIIFKGSNNLFELIQNNASYFDSTREVIVIEGDGNHLRLYNSSLLDMGNKGADSLLLVGNRVKYLLCFMGEPALKRAVQRVDTIQMENTPFNPSAYLPELPEESNAYLLIQGLLKRIQEGEAEAYYALAEMYNYGLENTPMSSEKAIALYEYGAVRGDKLSIRRLGDLWFNGSFDKAADKAKGRFYYRLGARLGDPYCQEMLEKK